jgi:Icc-related predicted phosphoesterase
MGSRMLGKLIQTRKPKLHLHGHAHQSTGILGASINGAYLETGKFVSIETELEEYRFVE